MVTKAKPLLSQTSLGSKHFAVLKMLATKWLRWQWRDCSKVLEVHLHNITHSIITIQAGRKEGRKFIFSKAILPKIQSQKRGVKGYIEVRRNYRVQNQKKEEKSTWTCWNKHLGTIRKLFALLCYPACGLIFQPGHLGSMLCSSFSLTLKKWII